MTPGAQQAPDRLPANFDFSKAVSVSPDRLPANFNFSPRPTAGTGAGWNEAEGGPGETFSTLVSDLSPSSLIHGAGQVIRHPIQAAQGFAELPENLANDWQSGHKGRAVAHMAELGAPAILHGLGAGAKGISRALPNAERAGQALSDVAGAAKGAPLNLVKPAGVALDMSDLADKGATMPKVSRDFLDWTTDPKKPKLNFGEARDFYSNASRLSADESSRLTPAMRRQVGMFKGSLGDSLTEAAGSVGQGEKYTQAMQEYRRAMQIQHGLSKAGDIAKKAAIPALIGGGTAGYIARRTLGQ